MEQKAANQGSSGPSRAITHVIFDFDGTLSWLRHGWPDVMLNLFTEWLPRPLGDSNEGRAQLRHQILGLNGKPSIHQMAAFVERAQAVGVNVPTAEELLNLYLERLGSVLRERVGSLQSGSARPADFIIAGALELLTSLRRREATLIILSGTAEPDVQREAELLGLAPFFGRHIYGSSPGTTFSKRQVIDRILREEGIAGSNLLSFGDGPVEIEFTKAVGGLAVGVASDEHALGCGRIDSDKRDHLLRAGADFIIPDYQCTEELMARLFS